MSGGNIELRVPAFCPVCGGLMKGARSTHTYYDFGCCRNCWVDWIDPDREDRWRSGWRPTPEDVETAVKRRE